MQHTTQGDKASAGGAGGLCVVPKLVRYRGKSVHPVNAHIGVNALTAARIGLDAVDHISFELVRNRGMCRAAELRITAWKEKFKPEETKQEYLSSWRGITE